MRGRTGPSDGFRSELSESSGTAEEEALESRTDLMHMWWDEAIARHMDSPDEYHRVAILLIKWADELDEFGDRTEVRIILLGYISQRQDH